MRACCPLAKAGVVNAEGAMRCHTHGHTARAHVLAVAFSDLTCKVEPGTVHSNRKKEVIKVRREVNLLVF